MRKLLVPLSMFLVCAFIVTGCSAGGATSATTSQPATSAPTTTAPPTSTVAPTTGATTSPTSKPPTSTAPTTSATPTGAQKYGGTVRYIAPTGPGAPFGAPWLSNGTSTYVMQFAQQFLLKEQIDGSLTPFLASSYDVVSDPANPSLTFHLQKGVKFSDGTDFNAAAAKWNLEKAMSLGSTTVGSTTSWKSVEALDDYTLRINLKTFTNIAARTLADSVSFMVSPTAFQKNGADWMNTNMVGTGPFVQTNFQRDVSLSLTRNTNYWETGKPYLDKMQLVFVSDNLTAEALFKSGGAEVIQVADDAMGARLESAGYKVEKVFNYGGALIPDSANSDSPWSNLKVRQAAEYAIDREALAKRFGYGTWQAAYQYSGSTSAAYDPALPGRKYDVAKAKQLLADAGYPTGFKTSIIVGATGVSSDVAVAIQAYFSAVGIIASLQFPQTASWSGYLTGTWKNALLFGAALGYANPNAGWNLAFSEGTAWYQSLKRPDAWKDTYRASLATPQLDKTLVKKLEGLLYDDATTIPLYTSAKQWGVVPNLRDAGLGSRGIWAWWEPQNAWLAP
jgi:peptide/nickel transport system substrate-binding protein